MTETPKEFIDRIMKGKTEEERTVYSKTRSHFLSNLELPPDTHIALFDERGDFGLSDESSKTFVVSASEIKDPDTFIAIALRHPKNTKGYSDEDSLKFNTSNDKVRKDVVTEIAESGADIHTRTFHKDKATDKLDGSRIHKDLLREVADDMMRSTEAQNLYVLIDSTTTLRGNAGCKVVRASADRKQKTIINCEQILGKTEPILQTHDFVVGGIGHNEENGDDTYVKQLNNNIKSWVKKL